MRPERTKCAETDEIPGDKLDSLVAAGQRPRARTESIPDWMTARNGCGSFPGQTKGRFAGSTVAVRYK
jgi:hypothetical protein